MGVPRFPLPLAGSMPHHHGSRLRMTLVPSAARRCACCSVSTLGTSGIMVSEGGCWTTCTLRSQLLGRLLRCRPRCRARHEAGVSLRGRLRVGVHEAHPGGPVDRMTVGEGRLSKAEPPFVVYDPAVDR